MPRPLFKLCPRLLECAKLVRKGSKVVDVGADHAYLAIWLCKNNIVNKSIATDLRKGPLINAQKNIARYGLEGHIETRLCNGLYNISQDEADDIIIAGMGGEIIIDIIKSTFWLKNPEKRLILQPMSAVRELRIFLKDEGYELKKEIAVISENKVYTIMQVEINENEFKISELYEYIGKLEENITFATVKYIKKEIKDLENQIIGLKVQGNIKKAIELKQVIESLEDLIKEEV